MSDALTGGCHCGRLRYTLTEAPGFAFLCTCDGCKRLSQGARLAGCSVKPAALTLEGEPAVYDYQGGQATIHLVFCPTCGTRIYADPEAYPDMLALRIGTLDDPNAIPKVKRIFADQACAWEPG